MPLLRQNGFSMIEVLISVLVLALGVIGVAGMQLTALRTTQQSAFQTIALELASEMADKMRTNTPQMRLADGANPFLKVNYKSASDPDPVAPGAMCYNNSLCDAQNLAAFEIYEWERRLKTSLPGGRVLICRDATPWDSSVHAFTWGCNAAGTSVLVIKIGWQGKNPDGSLIRELNNTFPPGIVLAVNAYSK